MRNTGLLCSTASILLMISACRDDEPVRASNTDRKSTDEYVEVVPPTGTSRTSVFEEELNISTTSTTDSQKAGETAATTTSAAVTPAGGATPAAVATPTSSLATTVQHVTQTPQATTVAGTVRLEPLQSLRSEIEILAAAPPASLTAEQITRAQQSIKQKLDAVAEDASMSESHKTILQGADEKLADQLQEAINASTPEERAGQIRQVSEQLARLQAELQEKGGNPEAK